MRAHSGLFKLIAVFSHTPHVFFFPVPPTSSAFGISPPPLFRIPPSSTFSGSSSLLVRKFPVIRLCDLFCFLAQESALHIQNSSSLIVRQFSSFFVQNTSAIRNPESSSSLLPNFARNRDCRGPLVIDLLSPYASFLSVKSSWSQWSVTQKITLLLGLYNSDLIHK